MGRLRNWEATEGRTSEIDEGLERVLERPEPASDRDDEVAALPGIHGQAAEPRVEDGALGQLVDRLGVPIAEP